jgi:hypothetical protein
VPGDDWDQPLYFYPVGSFDLARMRPTTAGKESAPLGAYDQPSTTAARDGTEHTLQAGFAPGGLVAAPPLALADLADAGAVRGADPIDAVRVRLTGDLAYDAAGVARLERVANTIAGMGMAVDIVAGSSPQPVAMTVDGWIFADGSTGTLHDVSQQWTTLGATQRVDTALSSTTRGLLALAMATALVGVVSAQGLVAATRRREAAVLRSSGWGRARTWRWLVADSVVAAVIAAALATAVWWWTNREPVGLAVAFAVAALLPLTAAVAAVPAAWRTPSVDAPRGGDVHAGRLARLLFGASTLGFGVRSAAARPARLVAMLACTAVLAAALGLAVTLVVSLTARAGPTLLASGSTAVVRPYQTGLLAAIAVVGLVLSALLLRHDTRTRAAEWRVLAANGWDTRRSAASRTAQLAVVGILATPVAVVVVATLSPAVAGGRQLLGVLAAVVICLGVVGWGRIFHRGPSAVPR